MKTDRHQQRPTGGSPSQAPMQDAATSEPLSFSDGLNQSSPRRSGAHGPRGGPVEAKGRPKPEREATPKVTPGDEGAGGPGGQTEEEDSPPMAGVTAEILAQRAAVEEARGRGGIEVAVYATTGHQGMDEIADQASSFADQHGCVGFSGSGLIWGAGTAFAADSAGEVIDWINNISGALELICGEPVPISTLALFAHGFPDRLQFGDAIVNEDSSRNTREIDTEEFAAAIDGALSSDGRVVIYACQAGSTPDESATRDWGSDEQGGEGSFGDALRDALTAGEGNEDRAVWAHQLSGHTTGNATWREFDGRQEEGADAIEELFTTDDLEHEHLIAQKTQPALVRILRRELTALGVELVIPRIEDLDDDGEVQYDDDGNIKMKDHPWLRRWIAREMPFADADCQPFSIRDRGQDDPPFEIRPEYTFQYNRNPYAVNPDAVAWFIDRYHEQEPDREQY